MNLMVDYVMKLMYRFSSRAHRGAFPETVPLAEQGVAFRGGGS
jgi:hypothetical protein